MTLRSGVNGEATMATVDVDDRQYRDRAIVEVEAGGCGGWSIRMDDGWSLWVPPESPVDPRVGSTARLYGKGLGYTVRGLVIDGETAYYRTEAEDRANLEREIAEREAESRKGWEAGREDLERRSAALPMFFRDRIDRFRSEKPDERHEWEPMEVFVSEQAALIAGAMRNPEAVDLFLRKRYEEQKAAVPGLDDGHSGSTFGGSCSLAKMYLESLVEPAPR